MKVFSRTMLPEMATECLSRMANNETIHKIYVSVDDEVELGYQVSYVQITAVPHTSYQHQSDKTIQA